MKKLLAIMLVLCVLCFSGCGLFKELFVEMDKATALVEDFCQCLARNDIEGAKAMMHPQSNPKAYNLSNAIRNWENQLGIDFSNGIGNKLGFSIESNGYNIQYDGMVHEIEFARKVGDKRIEFEFVVVKNDAGYGIYYIDLHD